MDKYMLCSPVAGSARLNYLHVNILSSHTNALYSQIVGSWARRDFTTPDGEVLGYIPSLHSDILRFETYTVEDTKIPFEYTRAHLGEISLLPHRRVTKTDIANHANSSLMAWESCVPHAQTLLAEYATEMRLRKFFRQLSESTPSEEVVAEAEYWEGLLRNPKPKYGDVILPIAHKFSSEQYQ